MEREKTNDLHTFLMAVQILVIVIFFVPLTYIFFVNLLFLGFIYSLIIFIVSFALSFFMYFILWFFVKGWKWWIKLIYKGIRSDDGFIETISRYRIFKGF